jgi:ring-1,2-phenylacetyl-CoA epoxidase subunit PaaD
MVTLQSEVGSRKSEAETLVSGVADPELPMLSIVDLGVLRGVEVAGSAVTVTITPTYSGCPAMDAIKADITSVLESHGFTANIKTSYSPPWTTDMISPEGRVKLAGIGIAPPGPVGDVTCPRCSAGQPRTVSEFGSTACKALMVCSNCGEPFDLFKELR